MIKQSMEKTLDKITIKKGHYKPKLTMRAKQLKEEKKRARREFEYKRSTKWTNTSPNKKSLEMNMNTWKA